MKVALVYDRVNKWGGAESVLLALHDVFPEAPLYTSVYDKEHTPWANVFEVRPSFLQKLPLPKGKHEYYPFLMGPAFESFDFDQFDVVISVTHEFAKAIVTKPKTLHVCYCLTPTSYLWSGRDAYFTNKLLKLITAPLVKYLRWYDKIIANRPDKYIAISKIVQDRIKKYYSLSSDLVYPPVTIRDSKVGEKNLGYYLIVSRLVPNKKINICIEAFNELGFPLKIIGTGREEKRLRSIANDNIEFLGHLTDAELARYYSECKAVILPGLEDFGIVPLEAQSFGKPVIAFKGGGALETIIQGETGFFFDHQTKESLIETVRSSDIDKISSLACRENAKKFSKERFEREFKKKIEELCITF